MARTRRAMLRAFVNRMDPDAVTAWLAKIAIDDMDTERLEYYTKQLDGSENGYGLTRDGLLRNLKLDGLRPRIMEFIGRIKPDTASMEDIIFHFKAEKHNAVIPDEWIKEGLRSLVNLGELTLTLDFKVRIRENAA